MKARAKQVDDFGELMVLENYILLMQEILYLLFLKIKLYSIYKITSKWKGSRRKKLL